MSEVDPYALDIKAGKKQSQEVLGSSNMGLFCPARMYNKPCAACEAAKTAYDNNNEKIGQRLYVKKLPLINAEFLNDRGNVITLALPVKAAKAIMENVFGNQSWGNIIHPTKGLPLILSKTKNGEYPDYPISPKVAAEESEKRLSSANVIRNAPTKETIFQYLLNDPDGKLKLFIPRRDMKIGDNICFKVIPNPAAPSQPFIYWAYVHFGVTQAQINGEQPINLASIGTGGGGNPGGNPSNRAASGTPGTAGAPVDDFGLGTTGGGSDFEQLEGFDDIPF